MNKGVYDCEACTKEAAPTNSGSNDDSVFSNLIKLSELVLRIKLRLIAQAEKLADFFGEPVKDGKPDSKENPQSIYNLIDLLGRDMDYLHSVIDYIESKINSLK